MKKTSDLDHKLRSLAENGGTSNSFGYNGLDARTSKTDSVGTQTYKRDGAEVTATVLSDGSAAYTPRISERRAGSNRTYHLDRIGTVLRQSDSTQAVLNSRAYDAFGMLMGSSGTTNSPFGFVGSSNYQEDGDSGLILLGHRYYDPATGGFLTRDAEKYGKNWYAYCENNPLSNTDPEGESAKEIDRKARNTVLDDKNRKDYITRHNNPSWSDKGNENTDCGVFASECARAHDPNYPFSSTGSQKEYADKSPNWDVIPIDADTRPQPGDILWRPGHTGVYVGDVSRRDKKGKRYINHGSQLSASLGGHAPKFSARWDRSRFTHIIRANN